MPQEVDEDGLTYYEFYEFDADEFKQFERDRGEVGQLQARKSLAEGLHANAYEPQLHELNGLVQAMLAIFDQAKRRVKRLKENLDTLE